MSLTLFPHGKDERESGPGERLKAHGPFPLPDDEWSDAFREELLDPTAWQEGLERYAQAMRLGVLLVDARGHAPGPCFNPRPFWTLLRAHETVADGACPFALMPLKPCSCVADALKNGSTIRAQDRTGLVHFAVPLALGNQKLGVLLAGQVFNKFPEQLPLEKVALRLGLSPVQVWQQARLEYLISPSMLRVYESLLATLGQTFLQNRYNVLLESARVAELRRVEAALRQANEELERRVEERTAALEKLQTKTLQTERLAAIGQMVTGLAHESRNAIQRGKACLEMVQMRIKDQPETLELLTRAQDAQDDLHRLYEGVRSYASPLHFEGCVCDLAEVWRETWADLAHMRNGRDAELRDESGAMDLRWVGSRFHLKQVFRNLFENSLSAGADPLRIMVRCSPALIEGAPAIQVSVRDNGPGLSEAQRHRVFDPFYTTKVRGTGLGLAICKRIVEAHGGRIAVGEATSAEILLTLPLHRGEPGASAPGQG